MFQYIRDDGNAPLIYAIMRLWALVFGGSDLSFRLLAVILGTAIVPLSYLIFRDWLGKLVAVQIALLISLCAPLVHFGTLARGYGLLPLLSLLATYQAVMLLDRGGNRKQQFLYALTLALAVYLHHWGAMLAIGHAVVAVVGLLAKWWDRQRFFRWLQAAIVSALMYLPWFVVLLYQLKSDVSPWILVPPWSEIFFYTAIEGLSGYRETTPLIKGVNELVSNILYWTCLLIPVTLPSLNPGKPAFKSNRWQIIAIAGLLAAGAISQVRPIWRDRYLMVFAPLWLVLQATVFRRFTSKLPVWLAAALPVLVWLPSWGPQLIYFHRYPESSSWVLAEQIGRQVDPSKDLVVVSFEAIAPQIHRYLPGNVPMIAFPDMERVKVIRWAGIDRRIREEERMHALLERMKKTLENGGDIWLVESVHHYFEVPLDVPLDEFDFNSVETLRMNQIRTWLQQNAKKDPHDLWAPGREFAIMASRFSLDRKQSIPPPAQRPQP